MCGLTAARFEAESALLAAARREGEGARERDGNLCADAQERSPEWLQAGNLLYTLEQVGWRKGEPVRRNRLMVRVEGGPDTPAAEVEALVAFLLAALARGAGR